MPASSRNFAHSPWLCAESVDPGVNLIPITDQTEMLAGLNVDEFIQLSKS